MKKNQLMKNSNGEIIRILAMSGDDVFYIPCRERKKKMPEWASMSKFDGYLECTEDVLQMEMGVSLPSEGDLDAKQKGIAHKRYTLIHPILMFLEDDKMRIEAIKKVSLENNVSEQTLRSYLQRYLVFNSIVALVPNMNVKDREMTDDEKNFRWAINKYYYSRKKNSLNYAYKMMISDKYTNDDGEMLETIPSFNRFRYWYSKNKKMLTYYISRDGMSDFMRNNRVLLGDNVQAFANAPGMGMVDSTTLDIYVVDDKRTQVVGRPIFSAMVDAYSSLCLGYYIGWEGGEYSLRNMMVNVIGDKMEHCGKLGINISEREWVGNVLPATIITDRGSDYAGYTYSQLTEIGINIVNLEGYRADEKGPVEKLFDVIQGYFKPELKGVGVVAPEYLKRGSIFGDYKENACLTLIELEKIIVKAIIHYNNNRIIKDYPFTNEMLELGVKPYAKDIWDYGTNHLHCNLISNVSRGELVLTLLPRTKARFTRYGLKVNKMRYFRQGYIEQCLRGGETLVAFDKDNVSNVWLVEDGKYVKFDLIESRYKDMDLLQVEEMKRKQAEMVKNEEKRALQSEIRLVNDIKVIKDNIIRTHKPVTKNIAEARRKERGNKKIVLSKEVEDANG